MSCVLLGCCFSCDLLGSYFLSLAPWEESSTYYYDDDACTTSGLGLHPAALNAPNEQILTLKPLNAFIWLR